VPSTADSVNVDFDVYRIRTEGSEHGGTIDAGLGAEVLDRAVVAKDQIRTVRTFKER
jgi:hypothetical protein